MRRQEEKLQLNLQSWIDDLFWRALEWVLANAASWVVDTTKAGVVHNALSHLVGAKSKGEFVCGAVRGFGSNLLLEKRAELAKQIYSWGNETPADHRRPPDGIPSTRATRSGTSAATWRSIAPTVMSGRNGGPDPSGT